MTGVVFSHTLRRNWRAMLYWGIGLAVYALYTIILLPSVDALKQYTEVVANLPPAMLQVFGINPDTTFMATPNGFLSFGFFGYVVIMLAVYAVAAGLNVTANEEDQGILDVMLSLPLPRHRLILEKFAAYTLLMAGIIFLTLLGFLAGLSMTSLEFNAGRIVESTINMMPSLLLVMAFTICVTSFISSKGKATAIAALFVVVSYFLNVIGSMASDSIASVLSRLSFLYYYDNNGVMQHGLVLLNVAGLLVAAIALVAAGIWAFQRRDVGI